MEWMPDSRKPDDSAEEEKRTRPEDRAVCEVGGGCTLLAWGVGTNCALNWELNCQTLRVQLGWERVEQETASARRDSQSAR